MSISIDEATRHYNAGRLADAIAACRTLLQQDAANGRALNLLGVALASSGDADAAEDILSAAVRAAPGDLSALTNLAVLRLRRHNRAAAERALRRLAVLDPASAIPYSRLGTVWQETGDLDRSLAALRRAAALKPASGVERYNLGMLRLLTGDYPAAVGAMRDAAAENPGGPLPHAQLGELFLRLGRLDEAAVSFRRALRIDPNHPEAARGLARHGRYGAAASLSGGEPGGLVMRGAFGRTTGYGHFCQRLILTLRARRVPLQAIGIFGPESWPSEPLDRPVPARALVNCLIPLAVERVPGLATVTFTMFEGPRIPVAWRRQSESSDLVVVPTESSRLAWAAQGFPEHRLRVCPLGVDPVGDGPCVPPTLVDPNGRRVSDFRHRFLNISDFVPRKNIDGLLRVWLRATRHDDDAVLILKLGKGDDRGMMPDLAALVRLAERTVGKRLAEAAPVVLIDRRLDDAEMSGLYRAATHYWSLSHGEGWDLPMSTAGAMGLGLIAPRHSAYLDYLDDRTARLIPSTIGPALLPGDEGFYPPFHGLDWWNPDEDAAAAILAGIIHGGDRLPSASAPLLERFTWERAADRLLAILDEAGLRR